MILDTVYPHYDIDPNDLIERLPRSIFDISNRHVSDIIPLTEHRVKEYIAAHLLDDQFVNYFRDNPFGETGKYYWETRKVDELINLRIFKK